MPQPTPQKVLITWTFPDSSATGQVILDASLSEQHITTAEVTKHQVERGSDITDHIRPLPARLSLEAIVTNTPLGVPETQADGVTGSIQDTTTTVNGQRVTFRSFVFSGTFDRVRDVFGDIVDAIQGAALFSVTTTLKRYENLACTNFVPTRNADKGNALHFTIDFEEIRLVDTQVVAALPPRTQKQHRGAKTGKQLDPKTDAQKISVLSKVTTSIFGAFK
jgi:hypothetical protein